MSILRQLRPLVCRHVYYWSERHLSERCRYCRRFRPAPARPVDKRPSRDPAWRDDRPGA